MRFRFAKLSVFCIAAGLMVAGCQKKAAADNQAFNSAPPEIKQVWDKAVADDKANDYVAAVTGYHELMAKKSGLTPSQLDALNAAALAINQRLYTAANAGDAAAKEASMKLAGMQNQH